MWMCNGITVAKFHFSHFGDGSVMIKCPWSLTWVTMVHVSEILLHICTNTKLGFASSHLLHSGELVSSRLAFF